ncbi:hypothetical protein SDC9_184659 [bioreactor metagenome]|uniref:Uncharacterized protein n=1 Tax=bioreactor metagenome TaxID=1076179 RepID=A0A645HNW6_9ZZZZ
MLQFQFNGADLLFHGNDFRFCKPDFFVYAVAAHHFLMLGQIAQAFALGKDDIPAVRRQFSYDYF